MGYIILAIIVVIGVWVLFAYNRLVRLGAHVQNAWRQIDVQLRRRYDLIPNLLELLKGYMKFEKETLTKVTEARARAMEAKGIRDRGKAEAHLSDSLLKLFAVVENYPELKSNKSLLELQEELRTTENQIAFARQFYNDISTKFNIYQRIFPSSIVAKIFGFREAELFETEDETRKAPSLKLSV
jgi:LemA protein